jgi:N-methylhydantoinase B
MTLAADPIELELFRNRLESIAEDAATTVGRTAISPVVVESNDYSATILDAQGNLIIGGGHVAMHFGAAIRAVRATIDKYGDRIAPGDVFLANDPHDGGGLHPQDVFIERPLYLEGQLVGWVAMSAHMIDMGGLAPGSFAPAATECYQEAFRIPPVRVITGGEDLAEVWDLLRTNVRMSDIVEMDMRALVAGTHVAQEKLTEVGESYGAAGFVENLHQLHDLTEREMRRRIASLADGRYRLTGWTEWEQELYRVPCALIVDGERLIFDFDGASDQAPHFFNSKPYIVLSCLMAHLAWTLARDLPFTGGLFAPMEVRCPEGTIVNARPPAAIAASHMHVAQIASAVALQCVRLALAASPDYEGERHLAATNANGLMGASTWSGLDRDGRPSSWLIMEGNWPGGPARISRDGHDQCMYPAGAARGTIGADIEVMESTYPILVHERRLRRGVNGAGEHRSGAGCEMSFSPYGTSGGMSGQMLGMRRYLPQEGMAGGRPGATTEFVITRRDGTREPVSITAAGVPLEEGDVFEFRCASGGGAGDPLFRPLDAVDDDVRAGRLEVDDARTAYGAEVGDPAATEARRAQLLADRLAAASPAARPVDPSVAVPDVPAVPLYHGVVRRGTVAVAEGSGAVLAVAPDHWTDGCPVLVEHMPGDGPAREIRTYLDPLSGRALYVEAAPAGEPRTFEMSPATWTR